MVKPTPLTKCFKALVLERVAKDPEFAAALLREGTNAFCGGDTNIGKAIISRYVSPKGDRK